MVVHGYMHKGTVLCIVLEALHKIVKELCGLASSYNLNISMHHIFTVYYIRLTLITIESKLEDAIASDKFKTIQILYPLRIHSVLPCMHRYIIYC